MSLRKIASHFFLKGINDIASKPVVEFLPEQLLQVRLTGAEFREEAGMEFYAGLMIPAFIDVILPSDGVLKNRAQLIQKIRSLSIKGAGIVCVPNHIELREDITSLGVELVLLKDEVLVSINTLRANFFNVQIEPSSASSDLLREFCSVKGRDVLSALNVLLFQSVEDIYPNNTYGDLALKGQTSILLLSGIELSSFTSYSTIVIKKII